LMKSNISKFLTWYHIWKVWKTINFLV
jgi:hypothetical protein